MSNINLKVADILDKNREALLDSWQQQLIVNTRVLVSEVGFNSIKSYSEQVLLSFIDSLTQDLSAEEDRFSQTRVLLKEFIAKIDFNNVDFAEVVNFILTLKSSVTNLLIKESDACISESILNLTSWFDDLTFYIFSICIETRESLIREQQRAFMDVSVPVVRLWNQILMIPLVGMLDSSRTQQMMETMLGALEDYQSRVAILDISGIPVVDTLVARHLITAASAARLMGAECIITGVRARISQTLVQLGVDLSGFITRSTLADGFATALKITGQQIG
ncbi:MAG: STAS domain-containing protein [Desulfamplus sp.]|nr:STAS domain-containing protein [Desulfamplus sp.]